MARASMGEMAGVNEDKQMANFRKGSKVECTSVNEPGQSAGLHILSKDALSRLGPCYLSTRGVFHWANPNSP